MTGHANEVFIEQIIIYLVDENILPYYDDNLIFIPDTIYNRQITFNLFQGYLFQEKHKNLVSFKDQVIVIDCSNIENLVCDTINCNLTVNVVNSNKIVDLEPDQPLELLVENPLKEKPEFPISCFILNNELEIFSQTKNSSKPYFAKDPFNALCFFRDMAYKLINKQKFRDCFIVEVQRPKKEANYFNALKFLMRTINHKK